MKKITLLTLMLCISSLAFAQFPAPYCGPLEYNTNVEPITLVSIAEINNVTDATVDGSPAHEDFTTLTANLTLGEAYDITFEGNTAGGFDNSYTVFIDFNQNDILDDAGEFFVFEDVINGSTGTDGMSYTGSITVPVDALEGDTRMRVKKIYNSASIMDPCVGGGVGYGQAEDYTVNISAAGGGDLTCGDQYLDTGGLDGSYSNSELITTTIVPDTAGEAVTVTFTYVDIETRANVDNPCWDFLTVYDGPDAASPVLAAQLCGEESGDGQMAGTPEANLAIGDSFTSTHPSGALTFVFTSDGSVPETGWVADVTCAAPEPDCNVVENLAVSNIVDISADVTWDNDPTAVEGYQVVVFIGDTDDTAYVSALLPQGTAMDTATGLSPETMYEARVTTICQLGPNVLAFTERVPFTTMALGLADSAIVGYTISPNPAKNSINLNAAFSIENVIVSNVLGQQVMTNKGGSAALTLDISNLQVGTYFMKATVNGIDVVERFIKQ
jgi:hypothetical protein